MQKRETIHAAPHSAGDRTAMTMHLPSHLLSLWAASESTVQRLLRDEENHIHMFFKFLGIWRCTSARILTSIIVRISSPARLCLSVAATYTRSESGQDSLRYTRSGFQMHHFIRLELAGLRLVPSSAFVACLAVCTVQKMHKGNVLFDQFLRGHEGF